MRTQQQEKTGLTEWLSLVVIPTIKAKKAEPIITEGEAVTGKALEIMSQFTPVKIWTSLGNLTTKNIHNQISKGCGFLFFAGHGSPNIMGNP